MKRPRVPQRGMDKVAMYFSLNCLSTEVHGLLLEGNSAVFSISLPKEAALLVAICWWAGRHKRKWNASSFHLKGMTWQLPHLFHFHLTDSDLITWLNLTARSLQKVICSSTAKCLAKTKLYFQNKEVENGYYRSLSGLLWQNTTD